MAKPSRRGLMLVVSSPSGAGKTTLCKRLIAQNRLALSVSATTREPRKNECDGVDYHFCSEAEFAAKIQNNEFLEWAIVHGHHYGTPRSEVETMLKDGKDLVFDVDWQGAKALKTAMPEDVVSIFLLPPSMAILRQRLLDRRDTSSKEAARRLDGARAEIKHWQEYDYLLINDDLEQTYEKLYAIFVAAICQREQKSFKPLLDKLIQA